eukprot:366118-Chlamydomonas_euryale.AAC.1
MHNQAASPPQSSPCCAQGTRKYEQPHRANHLLLHLVREIHRQHLLGGSLLDVRLAECEHDAGVQLSFHDQADDFEYVRLFAAAVCRVGRCDALASLGGARPGAVGLCVLHNNDRMCTQRFGKSHACKCETATCSAPCSLRHTQALPHAGAAHAGHRTMQALPHAGSALFQHLNGHINQRLQAAF